jgi:hypothetical protein
MSLQRGLGGEAQQHLSVCPSAALNSAAHCFSATYCAQPWPSSASLSATAIVCRPLVVRPPH